jgi:hypothetical protein
LNPNYQRLKMKFLKRRNQVQKGIDEANIQTVSFYFSYRFLIGVIGFFGYMLQYMQKIDMSNKILAILYLSFLFKKKHILKRHWNCLYGKSYGCKTRE